MDDVNLLTERIIGCAIAVHRVLGPGLREATYGRALAIELPASGLAHAREVSVPIYYREQWVGDYHIDLIVEDRVIVEVKAVDRFDPLFSAQILAYMRAARKTVGLLINFNCELLAQGVKRFVL